MAQRVIVCSNCNAQVAVPDEYFSKRIRCYQCHSVLNRYTGIAEGAPTQSPAQPKVRQQPQQPPRAATHQARATTGQPLQPPRAATHQARATTGQPQQPYPTQYPQPHAGHSAPPQYPGQVPCPPQYHPSQRSGPSGLKIGLIIAAVVLVPGILIGVLAVAIVPAMQGTTSFGANERALKDLEGWVDYTEPQGRFTVKFPGLPEVKSSTELKRTSSTGHTQYYQMPFDAYYWESTDRLYQVIVYRRRIGHVQLEGTDAMLDSLAEAWGGLVEDREAGKGVRKVAMSGTSGEVRALVKFTETPELRFVIIEIHPVQEPSYWGHFESSLVIAPEVLDPRLALPLEISASRPVEEVYIGQPGHITASANQSVTWKLDSPLPVRSKSNRRTAFEAEVIAFAPGTYEVALRATDEVGRTAVQTYKIEFKPLPAELLAYLFFRGDEVDQVFADVGYQLEVTSHEQVEFEIKGQRATNDMQFYQAWRSDRPSVRKTDFGLTVTRHVDGHGWTITGIPTKLGIHEIELLPLINGKEYKAGAIALTVVVNPPKALEREVSIEVARLRLPRVVGEEASCTFKVNWDRNLGGIPEELKPVLRIEWDKADMPPGTGFKLVNSPHSPNNFTLQLFGTYERAGDFSVPIRWRVEFPGLDVEFKGTESVDIEVRQTRE